uniref:DNA sliding clamp PCNA n=1 Tax=Dunaliella tertiolecta TaxID=3047 RepID=A0A7S3R9Q3_DUNTE|mmetsp:Transcript_18481/g.51862  ORF Transcript_18481/g.51862 Transcript_18481/m.51862 type:complete len:268 (+) Transcript_18481:158-961(+)|eukprot:CAMPEP_0202340934 /NCGR_PEP_ID=MMETSP1126-20121109/2163_1 /ASSEMBLY_ACC=CAM_ASM_000457 /TAXON_ID=3047 /ORGANISM="Dunaliella tertiolecta, Strain CCMP1320" /LENGTH=267 /DNA_ID=CAMNT_0048931715 /DNA_START=153 /DNA_END=956 /DNA_ORIENTATION=-
MFEARMLQGNLLKKLVEALKELVQEVNFDVNSGGISLQAMDSSHVCLVAFTLHSDGFEHFRCDRPLNMGIHIGNLSKVLKCAGNEDVITLKADDNGDTLTLMFESQKQDRISDFDLKLMSIESEHLGIPDQDYSAEVKMPSGEYQRICRDLASIGDTVQINATKEGVKFTTSGDVGTANITLRHNATTEKPEEQTFIELNDPVSLTFALRYLNNFAKATPLAPVVKIGLTKDLPIVVEYQIGEMGHIKYFLAPKIDDEENIGDEEAS